MTTVVHAGDAIALMRTMPEASVDAVVTDPPYGDTSLSWDDAVSGWLPEVARVLKPSGSLWCFGSMRFLLAHAADLADWTLAQDIVWEKHNGSSSSADRFRRVHEHALHLYRGKWADVYHQPQYTMDAKPKVVRRKKRPPHWGNIGEGHYVSVDGGPRLVRSVIRVKSCHHGAIHPTQKPEGIIEPMVLYSCPVGGTVLDPFAGSGTTGVVCVKTGRNFIGIEIDPEMAERARHRIAESDPIGRQTDLIATLTGASA